MDEKNFNLFKKIIRMNQPSLKKALDEFMIKYYKDNKIVKKKYSLYMGNIPILLVAHLDTVFKAPPKDIYYDRKEHIIWSPQGLGADDRAGIFAIIQILLKGYKPFILFTTEEESGGVGATALTHDFPKCPFDFKYIVELDRQGDLDCVFYNCLNEDFQNYIESFNFVTDWGTFTDISIICPAWEIAGVNLSVGYLNEHSFIETLNTKSLRQTIDKVCKMLDDISNAKHYEYIENFNFRGYEFLKYYYQPSEKKVMCHNCHKVFSEDDVFPVQAKNFNGINFYCIDCVVDGVEWCQKCGQPFETDNENDILCPDCAGKERFTHSINNKGEKEWQKGQPPKLM